MRIINMIGALLFTFGLVFVLSYYGLRAGVPGWLLNVGAFMTGWHLPKLILKWLEPKETTEAEAE